MAYDPKAIANYFIDKARATGEGLTPMKLQKLVYFAHGWYLGLKGRPLLAEPVEAWQWGPVIPSLYHEFKALGSWPITRRAGEDEFLGDVGPNLPSDDTEAREFLDEVWRNYGGYTAIQLSNATHLAGTPWAEVSGQHEGNIPRGEVIPDRIIRDYYKGIAESESAPA